MLRTSIHTPYSIALLMLQLSYYFSLPSRPETRSQEQCFDVVNGVRFFKADREFVGYPLYITDDKEGPRIWYNDEDVILSDGAFLQTGSKHMHLRFMFSKTTTCM